MLNVDVSVKISENVCEKIVFGILVHVLKKMLNI